MKPDTKTKPYLTPNAVADLLMVSPVTVRQWAQKGDLKALTTPGGHRRFLLRDVEAFASARAITLHKPDSSIARILVVDDDEQFVRFLVEVLKDFPNTVTTEIAHNGFDAGRKVQTFQPHIVLLDLMMPGLNGFEVCRRLKEDATAKDVRIIAMTGYYTENNAERILHAGADMCLSKPLDKKTFLNAIGLENDDPAIKPVA